MELYLDSKLHTHMDSNLDFNVDLDSYPDIYAVEYLDVDTHLDLD